MKDNYNNEQDLTYLLFCQGYENLLSEQKWDKTLEATDDSRITNCSIMEKAAAHLYRGHAFYGKGRNQEAIDQYDIVLNKYARSLEIPAAFDSKGDALVRLGKDEAALICYREAFNRTKDEALRLFIKGVELYKDDKIEDAEKEIELFITLKPTSRKIAISYAGLSDEEFKKKNYKKALEQAEMALEKEPNYSAAWEKKGFCLEKLKRPFEETLSCFEKACETEPNYESYLAAGNFCLRNAQNTAAVLYFLKSQQTAKNNALASNQLGVSLFRLLDNKAYCDSFGTYFKQNGKDCKLIDFVCATFRQSIEVNPNDPVVHTNLGNTYLKLGNKDEAIKSFDRALDLDPTNQLANQEKRLIIKETGKYELDNDFKSIVGEDGTKEKVLVSLWKLQLDLLEQLRVDFDDSLKEVAHYTSVDALDHLLEAESTDLLEDKNFYKRTTPLKLCSVSFANDPHEGKTFQRFLGKTNGTGDTDRLLALQTSFSKRIDNLTQFRLYGKNSNKEEGTGVCLVFGKEFFADPQKSPLLNISNDPNLAVPLSNPLPLYWVLYYDVETGEFHYTPTQNQLTFTIDSVEKHKITTEAFRQKNGIIAEILKKIKENYNKIEKDHALRQQAWNTLIFLRHLIKDVAFADEQEARILTLSRHNSRNLIVLEKKGAPEILPNKLSQNYLTIWDSKHCIHRIIAGPKIKNFRQFADHWQREITLRNPNARVTISQSMAPLA